VDELEVRRVTARPDPAEVIHLVFRWDFAAVKPVENPVEHLLVTITRSEVAPCLSDVSVVVGPVAYANETSGI